MQFDRAIPITFSNASWINNTNVCELNWSYLLVTQTVLRGTLYYSQCIQCLMNCSCDQFEPLDLLGDKLSARSVCDAGLALVETVRAITLWCLTFLTCNCSYDQLVTLDLLNLQLIAGSVWFLTWNWPYEHFVGCRLNCPLGQLFNNVACFLARTVLANSM